jgi:hypothetical protein
VIAGGLRPDHATIARFRVKHESALGGLFSQVLRLLAAEGMVSLGTLSLDGTKLAGNAAQKANRTLPPPGTGWRPKTRHAGLSSKPSRWPGTPRQPTTVRGLPDGQPTSRAPTATTPGHGFAS